MFGLGCITYEIITGQKLFSSDWKVQQYAQQGLSIFPERWPPCPLGSRLYGIGDLAWLLLSVNPKERPSAVVTATKVRQIRFGRDESENNPLHQDFEDFEDMHPVVPQAKPTLQPGLRGKRSVQENVAALDVDKTIVHKPSTESLRTESCTASRALSPEPMENNEDTQVLNKVNRRAETEEEEEEMEEDLTPREDPTPTLQPLPTPKKRPRSPEPSTPYRFQSAVRCDSCSRDRIVVPPPANLN
jgi:hypothetical protein